MTALIQIAALLLLGSALFNHKAIEHWLMNHKAMGVGFYALMSWGLVAAVVWLLNSLGDQLSLL